MNHLFITPNDIALITGKSVRTANRYLSIIKDSLNKQKHQNVTIVEYANYEGIELNELIKFLQGQKGKF
ncbi:MAG: hypothetical protein HOO91_17780 [Bacteroidales bacterium]|nr:hypothetical protein [Bacteroidales bacterium]